MRIMLFASTEKERDEIASALDWGVFKVGPSELDMLDLFHNHDHGRLVACVCVTTDCTDFVLPDDTVVLFTSTVPDGPHRTQAAARSRVIPTEESSSENDGKHITTVADRLSAEAESLYQILKSNPDAYVYADVGGAFYLAWKLKNQRTFRRSDVQELIDARLIRRRFSSTDGCYTAGRTVDVAATDALRKTDKKAPPVYLSDDAPIELDRLR